MFERQQDTNRMTYVCLALIKTKNKTSHTSSNRYDMGYYYLNEGVLPVGHGVNPPSAFISKLNYIDSKAHRRAQKHVDRET